MSNSLSIRWDKIFLCSFVLLTAFLLSSYPVTLGGVLIGWASFTLFKFVKIINTSYAHGQGVQKKRSVSNILKGLQKQKSEKDIILMKSGLKAPLLILFALSALAALVLFISDSSSAIQAVGILTVSMLIFWHMQNSSLDPEKASMLGTLFAFVFCLQLLFFHNLSLNFDHFWLAGLSEAALLLMASYMGYIFVRGLIIRHKYHLFPATGLFLLIFTLLMLPQMDVMVLPVLAALFAICFAQSFPTSKPRYFLHSPYQEIIT